MRRLMSTRAAAALALILLARAAAVEGQLLRGQAFGPPDALEAEPNHHQRLRRRQLPSAVSFGFGLNEGKQEPDAEVAPGADLQTPIDPEHHRALPPMSHGWALENDDKQNSNDAQQPAAEPEHRKLPPLSHGWSPEAPEAPVVGPPEMKQQQEAAAEPQHRMLPPMSHGWALENPAAPMAAPEMKQQQQQQQQQEPAAEPEHRMLPPMSHGWALENAAGAPEAPEMKQQQEAAAAAEPEAADKQRAEAGGHHDNPTVTFGGFAG